MITDAVISRLLRDQSGMCWKCGRDLYGGYECHHAVYSRDVRFQKYLDMAENLILLCKDCHFHHGQLLNIYTRRKVWQWKKEHGYLMDAWHWSIPMLIRDRLDA